MMDKIDKAILFDYWVAENNRLYVKLIVSFIIGCLGLMNERDEVQGILHQVWAIKEGWA